MRWDGAAWRRLRLAILARDQWTCGWCGAEATTVDHVTPRYAGGTHEPANLVAACWDCQGKRAREQAKSANGWL